MVLLWIGEIQSRVTWKLYIYIYIALEGCLLWAELLLSRMISPTNGYRYMSGYNLPDLLKLAVFWVEELQPRAAQNTKG